MGDTKRTFKMPPKAKAFERFVSGETLTKEQVEQLKSEYETYSKTKILSDESLLSILNFLLISSGS